MAVRYSASPRGSYSGFEGVDIPEDFNLPACGLEDIDRALFALFDKELPLVFEKEGESKRIPVIYATGERAFILRRKKPLRDRSGALILPLISIMRTGLEQDSRDWGAFLSPSGGDLVIKKRLSPDNVNYRRMLNKEGLIHQEDNPQPNKHVGLSQRTGNFTPTNTHLSGFDSSNVYEIITIPVPRFFEVEYEVTLWAQYQQQMNGMIEAIITSYTDNPGKAFKIETDKGYWFVAHVDSSFSDQGNIDGFEDDERIIKSSFKITVGGYIINPSFPGATNPIRRYVSAPKMTFETNFTDDRKMRNTSEIPSGRPEDYIFEDFDKEDTPLPGSAIGQNTRDYEEATALLGGSVAQKSHPEVVSIADPFSPTGTKTVKASVKSRDIRKGETVYRKLL